MCRETLSKQESDIQECQSDLMQEFYSPMPLRLKRGVGPSRRRILRCMQWGCIRFIFQLITNNNNIGEIGLNHD